MQSTHQINKVKSNEKIESGLYVVSTPIGNLEDITLRALKILRASDFILCEDTRRSSKLLFHYKIKKKLIAYHKYNEKKISSEIITKIKKNNIISLISDAGTPTISDPGIFLIKKCIEEQIRICPVPGPSAVSSALSVSGFDDKYLFYGFLPKKNNEIEKVFKSLFDCEYSIVFFIPANKINFFLSKFKKYFLNREILIAREMTKIHETFIRNKVNLAEEFSTPLKGELTVILSNKKSKKYVINEINESVKMETKKMLKNYSLKDVVDFISKKENLSKKLIYSFCLKLRNKK